MAKYIIVIYTDIFRLKDFELISNLRDFFTCITKVSTDLNDQDKVLRVESGCDISRLLINYLENEAIKCRLMGIYQKSDESAIVIFERRK
jgi:hypothetical protein